MGIDIDCAVGSRVWWVLCGTIHTRYLWTTGNEYTKWYEKKRLANIRGIKEIRIAWIEDSCLVLVSIDTTHGKWTELLRGWKLEQIRLEQNNATKNMSRSSSVCEQRGDVPRDAVWTGGVVCLWAIEWGDPSRIWMCPSRFGIVVGGVSGRY